MNDVSEMRQFLEPDPTLEQLYDIDGIYLGFERQYEVKLNRQ